MTKLIPFQFGKKQGESKSSLYVNNLLTTDEKSIYVSMKWCLTVAIFIPKILREALNYLIIQEPEAVIKYLKDMTLAGFWECVDSGELPQDSLYLDN